jgi:NAD(P)-dependent dehydrogenase (short-subunit alcohol dehydrogenase family)
MKILITGGTNGMGKGLAKVLAEDPAQHELILMCRSQTLGERTADELQRTTGNPNITNLLCDLGDLMNVRDGALKIKDLHDSLDGIFFNAGMGYAKQQYVTPNGLDGHFQINYLAQSMLVLNLLDLLEKSEAGGRVVLNVSRGGAFDWNDLQQKQKWSYVKGIQQGMVAKRLFLQKMHHFYQNKTHQRVSFIGYETPKTVWTNQINIIPWYMQAPAYLMKGLGQFISIETSGQYIAPLFQESAESARAHSGQIITHKNQQLQSLELDPIDHSIADQDRLWSESLALIKDTQTQTVASRLEHSS